MQLSGLRARHETFKQRHGFLFPIIPYAKRDMIWNILYLSQSQECTNQFYISIYGNDMNTLNVMLRSTTIFYTYLFVWCTLHTGSSNALHIEWGIFVECFYLFECILLGLYTLCKFDRKCFGIVAEHIFSINFCTKSSKLIHFIYGQLPYTTSIWMYRTTYGAYYTVCYCYSPVVSFYSWSPFGNLVTDHSVA